jgi:hypothetical protein
MLGVGTSMALLLAIFSLSRKGSFIILFVCLTFVFIVFSGEQ